MALAVLQISGGLANEMAKASEQVAFFAAASKRVLYSNRSGHEVQSIYERKSALCSFVSLLIEERFFAAIGAGLEEEIVKFPESRHCRRLMLIFRKANLMSQNGSALIL